MSALLQDIGRALLTDAAALLACMALLGMSALVSRHRRTRGRVLMRLLRASASVVAAGLCIAAVSDSAGVSLSQAVMFAGLIVVAELLAA